MIKFLENLKKRSGALKKAKRIARGGGSGKGFHTATRGMKGQKSRTGGKPAIWFEGGQTPLVRRMPYKRGFINHNRKMVMTFNFSDIEKLAQKHKKITPDVLKKSGIVEETKGIKFKILSKGNVPAGVTFEGFVFSEKAKAKLDASSKKTPSK